MVLIISKILKLSLDKLDKREPLITYGMDSLMGVEFANAIEERFCIQMPMMSLSQSVTINAISERIYEKLQALSSQEGHSIEVSPITEKIEEVSA